ncbi:helix-turn-helix domain-containing protein [Actinocorallia herbida]|uniref:helix-turn-helix domain-containing protein n=1 Tax=Actinocorallia herbida TaxID=58109 RepID=UPI000F4CF3B0|nr:helix-turn-helix domain-containing protein [Actinocorallia herbida]
MNGDTAAAAAIAAETGARVESAAVDITSESALREPHASVRDQVGPAWCGRSNRRGPLAETLLTLLAGRNVPGIAAYLRVHPQTVRYRLRKLQDLSAATV